jgi:hypothetical protein
MSKIQERLNALRPYVVGIRYIEGIQLVDAVLKEGWTVPESKLIQKQKVSGEDNYYMFFSDGEEVDIDDLLDYVQEVINLNIEREKKYELLKVKVDELKRIFKENTLTKLQRLKFTFNEPDIIPSLMDMDDIDEDLNDELAPEEKMIESMSEVLSEQTNIDNSKEPQPKMQNNKSQRKRKIVDNHFNGVELPPKCEKVELEEFETPNVICKCGPDDICPICEEEKNFSY